jgi:lipid A 4'-phosphatase
MNPSRDWRRDLLAFAALAGALTLLFAATPLDLAAVALFYRAQSPDHWPLAAQFPWMLLYRAAPWIAASLGVAALAALGAGIVQRRAQWRRDAIFVLLALALGPGLVINAVLKDHWGRPRPRDVIEFGGPFHYVVAPLQGEGGKSFPCGDCSLGFLCAAGWWIWRRRRPRLAVASLAIGLALGTVLGLGRMAAGGHFLSDVAWSALLTLGVAHALYHHVLRIPAHETPDDAATQGP